MTLFTKLDIYSSKVVRLWERESGKAYTSIEATAEFNDIVLYPKSGLLFLANEQPRMQVNSCGFKGREAVLACIGLLHSLAWPGSPMGLLPGQLDRGAGGVLYCHGVRRLQVCHHRGTE